MAIKRITTNLIEDGSIGTIDIANNAITAAKITDGNITTAKLADLNVTAGKLAGTLDLTGKTVTVATATTGDSDTSPASTAFVQQEIAALVDSSPSALNTLNELANALGDNENFATDVTASIATKAPLDSPVFSSTYTSGQDETLAEFRRDGGAVAAKIIYADATTDMEFGTTTSHALSLTTADTRRLTIDSSGNIGIGTTNASSMFSGASQLVVGSGTGDQGITIYAGNSSLSRLHFADGTSGNNQYAGFIAYAHNDDKLLIGTGADGGTDVTIDGGKVGIGNSSPTAKLTIDNSIATTYSTSGYGATPANSMLYLNNTHGGSNTASLINFRTGSGDGVVGFVEGGGTNDADFVIQTDGGSNGVERLRITNDGNVGIGTSSPLSKLDVAGNVRISDGVLEFDKPSVYGFRFLQNDAGNDLSIQQGDANNANYATRLNIGSTGDITFKPGNGTIIVDGGTADYEPAKLELQGRAFGGDITAKYEVSDGGAVFFGSTTNHSVRFIANNDVKMQIDSAGSTTFTTGTNDGVKITGAENSAYIDSSKIADVNTKGSFIGLKRPEDGTITVNGIGTYDTASNAKNNLAIVSRSDIVFAGNDGEMGRFLGAGGLTFNGDTAAANALDDYEEGTWTPGFGGATLTTATGHYTKIGNQVTVHYHIVSTGGMPTSSAQVQISGLPFTIDSNGAGAIYARYYTPNDSTLTTILVDGDTFIRLININEQNFDYTVYGELEASHNNSVDIRGTATYKV